MSGVPKEGRINSIFGLHNRMYCIFVDNNDTEEYQLYLSGMLECASKMDWARTPI